MAAVEPNLMVNSIHAVLTNGDGTISHNGPEQKDRFQRYRANNPAPTTILVATNRHSPSSLLNS